VTAFCFATRFGLMHSNFSFFSFLILVFFFSNWYIFFNIYIHFGHFFLLLPVVFGFWSEIVKYQNDAESEIWIPVESLFPPRRLVRKVLLVYLRPQIAYVNASQAWSKWVA